MGLASVSLLLRVSLGILIVFRLVRDAEGRGSAEGGNSVFPYSEQANVFTGRLMLFAVDQTDCVERAKRDIVGKFKRDSRLGSVGLYRRVRVELRRREDVGYIREVIWMRPSSGLFPVLVGEVSEGLVRDCLFRYLDMDSRYPGFSYGRKLPRDLVRDLDRELLEGNTLSFLLLGGVWLVYEGRGYYSPIRIGENMQHYGIFSYSGVIYSLHYIFVREEYREKSIIDDLGSHRKKRADLDEERMERLRQEFIFRRSLLGSTLKEQDERMDMNARQVVILRDKTESDLMLEMAKHGGRSSSSTENCNSCTDIFKCPRCDLEIFPSEEDIQFNSLAILQGRGYWSEDTVSSVASFQITSPFYDKMSEEKYRAHCLGIPSSNSRGKTEEVGGLSSQGLDSSVGDDKSLAVGLEDTLGDSRIWRATGAESSVPFPSVPPSSGLAGPQNSQLVQYGSSKSQSPLFSESSVSLMSESGPLRESSSPSIPGSKQGDRPLKRLPRPKESHLASVEPSKDPSLSQSLGGAEGAESSRLTAESQADGHWSPPDKSQVLDSSSKPLDPPSLALNSTEKSWNDPLSVLVQPSIPASAPALAPGEPSQDKSFSPRVGSVKEGGNSQHFPKGPIGTSQDPGKASQLSKTVQHDIQYSGQGPFPGVPPHSISIMTPATYSYPYPYNYPFSLAPFQYPPPILYPVMASGLALAPAPSTGLAPTPSPGLAPAPSPGLAPTPSPGLAPAEPRQKSINEISLERTPSREARRRSRSRSKPGNSLGHREYSRRAGSDSGRRGGHGNSGRARRGERRKRRGGRRRSRRGGRVASESEYSPSGLERRLASSDLESSLGRSSGPRLSSELDMASVREGPDKQLGDGLETRVPTVRISWTEREGREMRGLIEARQKEGFAVVYPSLGPRLAGEKLLLDLFWSNRRYRIISIQNEIPMSSGSIDVLPKKRGSTESNQKQRGTSWKAGTESDLSEY
ncbi:putative signal peptide-containing protein [Cryptosporidium canis]|uniref:Signal peptide-containing protein n=1 Tax=Cryptosporidium canis TaxID=195482 RepID=A0A9D5HXD3_9CRYT|nr:putative signal peptide-containing protein [Cryptosporidium canis]